MNIFFTADLHLSHGNIIRHSKRPFIDLSKMNEQLIENINKWVKPKDTLYNLGDFCLGRDVDIQNFVSKINCKNHHLILGNHDKTIRKSSFLQSLFSSVKDLLEIKVQDTELKGDFQRITLLHYALRTWANSHYGSFSLHGHSHGLLEDLPTLRSMDVGVDAVAKRWYDEENGEGELKDYQAQYRPISYEEVKEHMSHKIFVPVDHNGE